ncbi:glycosyltransferase family 90 protein [Xylariaceae sp. FL0594]|nr:glycosyltransferase family 90 protein [Xylariaceae sp. FL0594]
MSSPWKPRNVAPAATSRLNFDPLSTAASTSARPAASKRTGGLLVLVNDAFTRAAAALLLCGAAAHHLAAKQTELASELLCWALLPLVFERVGKRHHVPGHGSSGSISRRHARNVPSLSTLEEEVGDDVSVHVDGVEHGRARARGRGRGKGADACVPSASLWVVAISIALCSIYKSERGFIVLFPLLIPLLLVTHNVLHPDSLTSPSFELHTPSLFSRLTTDVAGATLAALFAVFTLSQWDPFVFAMSLLPVAALLFTFTLLTPQTKEALPRWLRSFDMQATIRPLSIRVVATLALSLGVETIVYGFPSVNAVDTVALGLAKAFTWYFASQVARHTSWLTAIMASTFGLLATRSPYIQETGARALMNVVASLLALGQTIDILPKQAKGKSALWVFFLVPVLPYLANISDIRTSQSQAAAMHVANHPVEVLIREAKADFEHMLRSQSRTYAAAHDEYQRRYGYEPPYGFGEWYSFARAHHSPIIDEFDAIAESVRPFLRLSGREVLDAMNQAYGSLQGHELWRCSMSGQPTMKTYCSHPRRSFDRNVSKFLDGLVKMLPQLSFEVKFLVNHLDEPSVLIPPSGHEHPRSMNLTDLGGQRSWETLTKYCGSSRVHTMKNSKPKPPVETYGLPFVTDRRAALDLCAHPEYATMHGFLLAPESLKLIEGLVPVLSAGALSTMGDILYPLAAYTQDPGFRYDGAHDVEWKDKKNRLYWAGSNTGGRGAAPPVHVTDKEGGSGGEVVPVWRLFHRQRFVELAQNLKKSRAYTYLTSSSSSSSSSSNIITKISTSFLNSRLYNVGFARIFQCTSSSTSSCRDQRTYFRPKPWISSSSPLYSSTLVYDVDGNGVSGRFYKLLASKSTPLKQTLFREWHDERLFPWVHYVPVSMDLGEVPELVRFLMAGSGKERAKEIADQGREWFAKAFREVDMAIYVYRLLLELVRLQDPNRPAWVLDRGEG